MYNWCAPNTWYLSRSLCWWQLYICDNRKGGYVLRKLQRGLSAIAAWCECWNIKFNKDRMQAIYFSHRLRPPEDHLILNGRNTPFDDHVEYFSVISDKRITWRLHEEMIEAKAFRTFIRTYSLFKSERLSANIKLTNQISSDLRLSRLGISGRHLPLTIAAPAKQSSPHHWKFPKVHTGPRRISNNMLYVRNVHLTKSQAYLQETEDVT
jgi:hypothetical protein